LCLTDTAVNAAEFYAVVERNGTVALCLSKGTLLFADRCEGNGRLSVVQPIKEGAVVWRSAMATVSFENSASNTQCALSHAKCDPKSEEVISTGRKIGKVDRADLLKRLKQNLLKQAEVIEDDITAFALDLDGDGKDEIVFVASDLKRVADHYTGELVAGFFVTSAISQRRCPITKHPPVERRFLHRRGLCHQPLSSTGDIGGLLITSMCRSLSVDWFRRPTRRTRDISAGLA